MKTVSSAFVAAMNGLPQKILQYVDYKRRYWDQPSLSYVYEASWTTLPKEHLVGVSTVSSALDQDQLNEFKVSNVTITVSNRSNQWYQKNPAGVFGPDAGSTIGYDRRFTKFRVRLGFLLDDGSSETVAVFVGVADEYTGDSDTKQCQITVLGQETLLFNKMAERVATSITNELIGTGDDTTTDFFTLNPGVGGVTAVYSGGVVNTQQNDYTLDQTGEPLLGAKISFSVAPALGVPINADYFYWPQNKDFKTTVKDFLTAAGVASGNQLVQDVAFPNNVQNALGFTSQADFMAGVLAGIDTGTVVDSIRIDWTQVFATTTWSTSLSGWTNPGGVGFSSDGTKITFTDMTFITKYIYRASAAIVGAWSFVYKVPNVGVASAIQFYFNIQTVDGSSRPANGYYVQLSDTTGSGGINRRLQLVAQAPGSSGFSALATTDFAEDTNEHTLLVTMDTQGNIKVYRDGVIFASAAAVRPTANNFGVGFGCFNENAAVYVRDIRVPPSTYSAEWTSPAKDAGAAPSGWLSVLYTSIGATFFTDVSSDSFVTDDGFVALGAGDVPASTLKRYWKVKVRFSISTSAPPSVEPQLDDITVRYVTSSTIITLTDFAGVNIYDAVGMLATFANYEYGYNSDENFFFRARPGSSPVMSLLGSDLISRVDGDVTGDDLVYAIVSATYGNYTKQVTDDGKTPDSPAARSLDARFDITPDDRIKIPASADIATGVAAAFFAYLSKPRRRMRLVTRLIPQLELSDVITVSVRNNTPEGGLWWLGDKNVNFGDWTRNLHGENDQIVFNMDGKITGVRHNVASQQSEFDLEEVI